jgi:hypothetical protein
LRPCGEIPQGLLVFSGSLLPGIGAEDELLESLSMISHVMISWT